MGVKGERVGRGRVFFRWKEGIGEVRKSWDMKWDWEKGWRRSGQRKGICSEINPPPLKIFSDVFNIGHQLLAHAVFSSCSFIPDTHFGKVWRQLVAMVTRYDAISNMWSSYFIFY